MICAIHQPNFFPWLGYFDKIRRADVFVFLDAVAYPKSGSGMGSWVNRVRIDIQGKAAWVGCPLRRASGEIAITDARIDNAQPWRAKMLRTLEMNYKRAPNWQPAIDLLRPLIDRPDESLAEYNIAAIRAIAAALGLSTRFVRQSELPVDGRGTELLIAITKAVGASSYLCGGGAAGYQVDEMFPQQGLGLCHQNFCPTPYRDGAAFIPGLSVIDYLMWRPPTSGR